MAHLGVSQAREAAERLVCRAPVGILARVAIYGIVPTEAAAGAVEEFRGEGVKYLPNTGEGGTRSEDAPGPVLYGRIWPLGGWP